MRFVAPETVRIDLDGGDWIEVKKELSVGEERQYRTAGFKRTNALSKEIDVDWSAMALARVEAYLVGWSATDDKGKPVPVSARAIAGLSVEDFEAIDAAVQKHQESMAQEKKAPSGKSSLTSASA